jgi:hypothetical protein
MLMTALWDEDDPARADLQEAAPADAVAIPALGPKNGQHGGKTPFFKGEAG